MLPQGDTEMIMASLDSGIRFRSSEAILADIDRLRTQLRDPSEIIIALNRGLFDAVRRLFSSRDDNTCFEAVRMLGVAVQSLIASGDSNPLHVSLVEILLIFFRDHVLTKSNKPALCGQVFEAMRRVTESTDTFRMIVIEVFPLHGFEDFDFKIQSPKALDDFTCILVELCKNPCASFKYGDVLKLLSVICRHNAIQCKTVSRICGLLQAAIEAKNPALYCKTFNSSSIIRGIHYHMQMSKKSFKLNCFPRVLEFVIVILTSDGNVMSKFVDQGLFSLVAAVLAECGRVPDVFIAVSLKIVTECIARGSTFMDALLDHELPNAVVLCLVIKDPFAAAITRETLGKFLDAAAQYKWFVRMIRAGLLEQSSRLLSNEEVRWTALSLMRKIIQIAISMSESNKIKIGRELETVPSELLALLESPDEEVNKEASTIIANWEILKKGYTHIRPS